MNKRTNTLIKIRRDKNFVMKMAGVLLILCALSYYLTFIILGELDESNILLFVIMVLIFISISILITYYFSYLFVLPNTILTYPITDDDLSYVLDEYFKDKHLEYKLLLRGVKQPYSFFMGFQLCELYLLLDKNKLMLCNFCDGVIGIKVLNEELKYTDIVSINLTDTSIKAYATNYKFFVIRLKNRDSIQMLACDYDGTLTEEFNKVLKYINEKKKGVTV